MHLESERGEEPLVLARGVLLLEDGLDLLLGVLALRRLLEGVLGDGTLETLELESVSGGHEVVVGDDLDERLDLGSLGDLLGAHALGHLLGVSLNAGGNDEGERVLLGAVIELLDDDNLWAMRRMYGQMSVMAFCKHVGNVLESKKNMQLPCPTCKSNRNRVTTKPAMMCLWMILAPRQECRHVDGIFPRCTILTLSTQPHPAVQTIGLFTTQPAS